MICEINSRALSPKVSSQSLSIPSTSLCKKESTLHAPATNANPFTSLLIAIKIRIFSGGCFGFSFTPEIYSSYHANQREMFPQPSISKKARQPLPGPALHSILSRPSKTQTLSRRETNHSSPSYPPRHNDRPRRFPFRDSTENRHPRRRHRSIA